MKNNNKSMSIISASTSSTSPFGYVLGSIGHDLSKKAVTFEDILGKAEDIQRRCRDVRQPLSDLDFEVTKALSFDGVGRCLFTDGQRALLTKWSAGQLFERYGIGMPYALKCLQKHPELLKTNVDTWMADDSATMCLRLYDAGATFVRGIVTESYSPFDAPDILKILMQNQDLQSGYHIRNWVLNPERMQIRIVEDSPISELDDLFMGVIVDSSDVGAHSVNLSVMIYKQVCTNGLILPLAGSVYRQIHRGVSAYGFADDIAAMIRTIPDLRTAAVAVIEEAKGCKDLWFDLDDEVSAAGFAKKHGFNLGTVKKAIAIMKSGRYGEAATRWAFINGLTEAAQELGLDSRVAAEKAAGRLLVNGKKNPAA